MDGKSIPQHELTIECAPFFLCFLTLCKCQVIGKIVDAFCLKIDARQFGKTRIPLSNYLLSSRSSISSAKPSSTNHHNPFILLYPSRPITLGAAMKQANEQQRRKKTGRILPSRTMVFEASCTKTLLFLGR
jgi:hypothetical protein